MMTATVLQLPGTAPAAGLNLTRAEVEEASGGYVRPADQLRALQALGFTRAFRRNGGGPVILERGHYEAVIAGRFAQQPAANEPRTPLPPNRAGFKAKFGPRKQGA